MGREYFLYMSELQEDVTPKYFPFPQGNTIIPKRVSGKKREAVSCKWLPPWLEVSCKRIMKSSIATNDFCVLKC